MQRFDDLNRWSEDIPVADSSVSRMRTLAFAPAQESLDEVGGEPLAGTGFENEEPESEFAPREEEN
jgi:hypothetical protein